MSLNRLLIPFVPAEAGTQSLAEFSALDSRFRGNERKLIQRRCKPKSSRYRHIAHSGFMPEALTTLAHFSISWVSINPNSVGEPGRTAPPVSARRAFILGSA